MVTKYYYMKACNFINMEQGRQQPQGIGQPNPQTAEKDLFKGSDSKVAISQFSKYSERLDDIENKTRLIEDRLSVSSKKVELLEQNLIKLAKETNSSLNEINVKIKEIDNYLKELNQRFSQLAGEAISFAKKDDVEAIKKYLEFWNPVEFVTKESMEKIFDSRLKKTLIGDEKG
jgi:tetrahydromethanopterin S-methyltransferase subunit G